MKVLRDKCVRSILVPTLAKSGHKVAYNPVVDLYMTMDIYDGISAWNPDTEKVINITSFGAAGCLDFVLAPGNRVAFSYSEADHRGIVEIYSLEKLGRNSRPKPVLKLKKAVKPKDPEKMAMSSHHSLLIMNGFDFDHIFEIFIDWDDLKVIKTSKSHDSFIMNLGEECLFMAL